MISYKRKCQIIKTMIGEELLFGMGFSFRIKKNVRICSFTRKKGDVSQVIEVGPDVDTAKCFYMNIRLITSIDFMPNELTYILEEMENIPQEYEFQEPYFGWAYIDEASFISLLQLFKTLITVYALPEIERRSVIKEDAYVTSERFYYLQENLSDIVNLYMRQWDLTDKDAAEQLNILTKQITKYKHKPFFEVDKELANIAAIYGDIIINEFSGKWMWHDFSNNILVDEIANTITFTRPMYRVIGEWKEEELLIDDFNRIKEEILTSKPCPKRRENKIKELFK